MHKYLDGNMGSQKNHLVGQFLSISGMSVRLGVVIALMGTVHHTSSEKRECSHAAQICPKRNMVVTTNVSHGGDGP